LPLTCLPVGKDGKPGCNTDFQLPSLRLTGNRFFPCGIFKLNGSMATSPKQNRHKIAESIAEINFAANGLANITVAGKTITLALHNNEVFACTQKCPHAGGILADGYLDVAGNIVCPLHRYKYSLQNGRNVSGEGYFLKTFEVDVREDGVYVNFADKRLFD
jgi:3-phenylpropionate/trans-cinnamate dioxygenase ferredoxin subunit